MPTKAKSKRAGAPRRTNAERTAETRSRLIRATIDALYERGYSAATTIEVAKRARVSRGAMLHHFPTRVDLLLGAAEQIILEQRRYRVEKLEGIEDDWRRFHAAADVSWEVQKQPETIALLEIMMATRSDKDLRRGFAPFIREMAAMRDASAARLARTLRVPDEKIFGRFIQVHLAALRGLALNLMFTQNPEEVEEARSLLVEYERTFAKALSEQAASRRKSA